MSLSEVFNEAATQLGLPTEQNMRAAEAAVLTEVEEVKGGFHDGTKFVWFGQESKLWPCNSGDGGFLIEREIPDPLINDSYLWTVKVDSQNGQLSIGRVTEARKTSMQEWADVTPRDLKGLGKLQLLKALVE